MPASTAPARGEPTDKCEFSGTCYRSMLSLVPERAHEIRSIESTSCMANHVNANRHHRGSWLCLGKGWGLQTTTGRCPVWSEYVCRTSLRCRDRFGALPDLDLLLPNRRLPAAERLRTKVKMSVRSSGIAGRNNHQRRVAHPQRPHRRWLIRPFKAKTLGTLMSGVFPSEGSGSCPSARGTARIAGFV